MDEERWQRIKRIYQGALRIDESERRQFIEAQCGDDKALAAEVVALIDEPAAGAADLDSIIEAAAGSFSGRLNEGERIGPYRLLDVIGSGGMGFVYLAERDDREFEQRVAIKTVGPTVASPTLLERFRQERQILANLDHPGIARLLDGGTTESGVPYLVMEYIEGESIVDYCAREELPLNGRLDLFLKVCDALQYAHRQLVVHRDIKPSNILVTGDGLPKLLDFGVAKLLDTAVDPALTRIEARILTPEYASPEQVRGERVTLSTDVWGLGVLLYELLSGSRPFRAEPGSSDLLGLICETLPQHPSQAASLAGDRIRARQLVGDLDRIVMKAIRKEPERRYETVREFANDIRDFMSGRPVSARAPSWSYRTAKFFGRNRTAVTAAATAVIAALVLTVFHTLRLAEERDRANLAAREATEVSEFLAALFRGASPVTAQGEEVTAIDLLEQGSRRIDELDAQPILKASLLRVIGDSYTQLGAYDSGRAHLETALGLLENTSDADPLVVADVVASLARANHELQRHEAAIGGYRRALDLRRGVLGDEHSDVAFAMARLAGALGWQGRSPEALELLQQAIAIKTGIGEQDDELLDMLGIVAVNLAQSGRFVEAIETNRRSIDLSTKLLGERHPGTIIRIGNSGIFLHQAYRTEEGLRLLDESIALGERVNPETHPGNSYDRRWRARMLQRLGRFEEAQAELDKAAAITREAGREDSMEAVSNVYALARWRLEYGHPGAFETYEEGLALAKQRGSADSPAVYAGRLGGAIALARAGEFGKAEAIFTELLARQGRSQKSVEWNARKEFATALSRQGRFDEASAQFVRIFEEQEHGAGRPGGAAIEALIARAAHRRRSGDFDRAAADAQLARELAMDGLPAASWIVAMADAEVARADIERNDSSSTLARLTEAASRLRLSLHPKAPQIRELDAILGRLSTPAAESVPE